MRFLRVVPALVFGLAMAGPETHCRARNSAPAAPVHHPRGRAHQKTSHCTCPQACCPAGVSVSVPTPFSALSARPLPVLFVDVATPFAVLRPSRKHFLPFALAPPLALA